MKAVRRTRAGGKPDSYLVEFRFSGFAKEKIKDLAYVLADNFGVRNVTNHRTVTVWRPGVVADYHLARHHATVALPRFPVGLPHLNAVEEIWRRASWKSG